MQEAQTLQLQLAGNRLAVRIQRVGTVRSPHTGLPLTELHGVASTTDAQTHERLTRTLSEVGDRSVRSLERLDNGVARWRVSWNSYAESGGEHVYTLILREEEDLQLEALVIGPFELHPYEYREQFSESGELTISAKLVGSKQSVLRLRALLNAHPSFPVVRRGVHPEPRQMRFGVAEWSEHEGQIKYRVVLVDRDANLSEHPELLRIAEQNQRAALSYYMNFVERLAELLRKQGVLPDAEIEAARETAREEPWQGRREFWRVPDVDRL